MRPLKCSVTIVLAASLACRTTNVDSSDRGTIVMANGQVRFIGSLNDDDDDADNAKDLARAVAPPASENNLRELRFHVPDANWVYVAEPQNLSTQQSAIDDKIRAWNAAKTAPFQFGQVHPTSAANPLIVHLEGIETTALDEIGIEYQYFADQAMRQTVGGGASKSTVVRTSFHGSGRRDGLTERQKLLATGDIGTTATMQPMIPNASYNWTYDNATNGTFDPASATRISSRFRATAQWTQTRDQDSARFTLTDPRAPTGPIVLSEALNVVAPRTVGAAPAALPDQTGTLSNQGIINQQRAARAKFRLFRWRVVYTVLDQFGTNIYDAEKGGAKVEVREDVAIGSPFAGLNAWFANSATTPNWKPIHSNGTFPDKLASDRGEGIPYTTVLNAAFQLLPNVGGLAFVIMRDHSWHVTVDRARVPLDKVVTDNELTVTVTRFLPGPPQQSAFRSTYAIMLVP